MATTTARGRKAAPRKTTTRKTTAGRKPSGSKARTGKGTSRGSTGPGFWLGLVTFLGKIVGACKATRKSYRSGKRSVHPTSQRTSGRGRPGPSARPSRSSQQQRASRGGGQGSPVDPRSVEEVWATRGKDAYGWNVETARPGDLDAPDQDSTDPSADTAQNAATGGSASPGGSAGAAGGDASGVAAGAV